MKNEKQNNPYGMGECKKSVYGDVLSFLNDKLEEYEERAKKDIFFNEKMIIGTKAIIKEIRELKERE